MALNSLNVDSVQTERGCGELMFRTDGLVVFKVLTKRCLLVIDDVAADEDHDRNLHHSLQKLLGAESAPCFYCNTSCSRLFLIKSKCSH